MLEIGLVVAVPPREIPPGRQGERRTDQLFHLRECQEGHVRIATLEVFVQREERPRHAVPLRSRGGFGADLGRGLFAGSPLQPRQHVSPPSCPSFATAPDRLTPS